MSDRAWACALRLLAARRLTTEQLRERLQRRGFSDEAITVILERARTEKYLDDDLYAQLYLEGQRRPVSDRRLIGKLVRRGISREQALAALCEAPEDEDARLHSALRDLRRKRPALSLPSAARSLERLGFPAAAIYRILREEGAALFAKLEDSGEEAPKPAW